MNTLICVPTLNEEATIGSLVSVIIDERLGDVLVVDDGSTDATVERAYRAGASTIVNPERQGLGPSLMLGWYHAVVEHYDSLVQIDAGGSHNPRQIYMLKAAIRAWSADDRPVMVIGSRFLSSSRYIGNPSRARLSRLAAWACNRLRPPGAPAIRDWTSGFRAFNRSALKQLSTYDYNAKMHGWQIEVLYHALQAGFKVVETPIEYTAGRSQFNRSVAIEAARALYSCWRSRTCS